MGTQFRILVTLASLAVVVLSFSVRQPLAAADPPRTVKAPPDPFGGPADLAPKDTAPKENPAPNAAPKVHAANADGLSPEEHARSELSKPTKIEFIETPLKEVLEFVGEQHGLNIQFDDAALKEAGMGSDTPVQSVNLKGISLASALQIILRPLKLTDIVVRDGILLITTQEAASTMLAAKIYPVQDLIATKDDLGENILAYDELIDAIVNATRPPGWDSNGGPGSIKGVQGTLAVNQTQEMHAKIATLLAALREAKLSQQKATGGPAILASGTAEQKSAHRKLSELLEKPGQVEFIETPLKEVMDFICENYRIPIVFDEAALKEAGLGSDTPVPSVNLKNLPVRAILWNLLRPLKLTYVIQNEVVTVTTQEAANLMTEARVYPVADLMAWKTSLADDPVPEDVLTTITSAIGLRSWDRVGGPGTIRYYAPVQALVISQTQETHAEIERLLEQIRADHREHPAPPATAAAVPFEDKPLTRTFALKTDVLSAAEIVELVKTAQAKAWTAEGAFIHPVERVEIVKSKDQPDSKNVHGSLIARQKPAAFRELRRLLREMDVGPMPADVADAGKKASGGAAFEIPTPVPAAPMAVPATPAAPPASVVQPQGK